MSLLVVNAVNPSKRSPILRSKKTGFSFSTTEILTLGAAVGMVAGSVASASAQFFGVRRLGVERYDLCGSVLQMDPFFS